MKIFMRDMQNKTLNDPSKPRVDRLRENLAGGHAVPPTTTVMAKRPEPAPLHPAHAASLEHRKSEAKAKERIMEIAGQYQEMLGLKILHVRNYIDCHKQGRVVAPKGGVTVAYRTPLRYQGDANKSSMIEVATSVCSVEDSYDKDFGRAKAIQSFALGRYILMPVEKNMTVDLILKRAFSSTVYL